MNAVELHPLLPARHAAAVGQTRPQSEAKDLRAAAEQFEALFIQMILRQMRTDSPEDGVFGGSRMDLAFEMFDSQVAGRLAGAGGLGLADMLVRQLSPEQGVQPERETQSSSASPGAGSDKAVPGVSRGATSLVDARAPVEPDRFVEMLLPLARKAAKRLGVPAEAIVAQSVLETGWGRQMLSRPDGAPAWNLFGVKADDRWHGDRVNAVTLEVRDGIARREVASFRAYGSAAEAVDDYVRFLRGQPRYAGVTGLSDPGLFARALQQAGYATDPDYAAKIERLADQISSITGPGSAQEPERSADV